MNVRHRDLMELGRDAAELALRLSGSNRTMPFSDAERRIALASMIRTILGTGAVTMEDVTKQYDEEMAVVDRCDGVIPFPKRDQIGGAL